MVASAPMGASPPRLAELLGSLSLATDVAAGLGAETALRTALYAVRLAAAADVQGFERADTYYAGVLRHIGCTAYAHEMAWRYGAGDDLGIMAALAPGDARRPADILARAARGVNRKAPLVARAAAVARLAAHPRAGADMGAAHCDLAVRLAARLGMSEGVIATLGQMYERWDGRGAPARLRGDAIRIGARVLQIAWRLAVHVPIDGAGGALESLRARAGSELDAGLVRVVERTFAEIVTPRDAAAGASVWAAFLDAEPAPVLNVAAGRVPRIALAVAHYVDVKSPYTLGHSTGVAALVRTAADAGAMGLNEAEREDVYVSALLHDLGRVGVANGIWDKPGPLDGAEREAAEAHAYQTERILKRTPLLEKYAALASAHHERLDGNGYHRRLAGAAIPPAARLLAAADVYRALVEERAYRPAFSAEVAAAMLTDDARAGRLDRAAVEAVLAAAGHVRARVRGAWPRGLSDREVEVLRLVARGLTNKEVGDRKSTRLNSSHP